MGPTLKNQPVTFEGGKRGRDVLIRHTPELPLISIITVTFNASLTLPQTIRSVIEQNYANVEYIVVDGGSTDSSRKILHQYENEIDYWISEKDNGIYDAMNKGISLASGEIIGFLNADDFYASDDVLTTVAKSFESSEVAACYGDLCYVKQNDTSSIVRYWRSSPFHLGHFKHGWCPPHPTFFVRKKVYERFGVFDLGFKIAADTELMMRLLEVHKIRAVYISKILVMMRLGGTTNRSLMNILKQNKEILIALRKNKIPSSIWRLIGGKVISKGMQFIIRPSKSKKGGF